MARPTGDTELFADVVAMRMLVLWGRPGAAAERVALAAEVLRLPLSREQELYARSARPRPTCSSATPRPPTGR